MLSRVICVIGVCRTRVIVCYQCATRLCSDICCRGGYLCYLPWFTVLLCVIRVDSSAVTCRP